MKKYNSLFTLLLFFLKFSFAQTGNEKTNVFGNQEYLCSNSTTSGVGKVGKNNKQNSLWPERNARSQMQENEMAAYRQRATLMLPSTGTEYDVTYYRLELRINPDTLSGTKYIRGKVTTYFKTTQANFSDLDFDFASPLTCDSVYYHGAKLAAGNISRPTDLLNITLPIIAAAGTLDSVSVYYKGVPPLVAAFSGGTGYVNKKHNSTQNYVYTLSEPYSSYTWWPCKSFIVNDKADSLDLIISTPTGFKAAGNGTLVSATTIGSNIVTYWKHRYPIAAYQVCTAVANYDQYPTTPTIVNIGGTNMPLYNYIFPETNTSTAKATLDRTALMLTTFSSKFGDYPFKNEKYGHYTFGFSGGMEHNTFSGMSASTYDQSSDWDVIAHELGHQWFGANVTCGSWHEIWINESFATFTESICAEFAPSVTAGVTGVAQRAYHKGLAINTGNQLQSVYVSDTSTMTSIFTPAVYVYERGAMVLYMLRTLLGDTKFFQAIKNYQADPLLKYGNAITADVKRHMEAVSGLNLTTFFNQWIYNTGFARYNGAKWNNSGTQIILQLPQTTYSSALTHFDMPIAVRIQGVTGDTTVVVYDQGGVIHYVNNGLITSTGSNMVQFTLSFIPTTITFDAYSQVLAEGSFAKSSGLIILASNILNFSANRQGDKVKLWLGLDKNADYSSFEIERSSDGTAFETIGHVKKAELAGKQDLSFTDASPLQGVAYYRIKAVEKNGNSMYTKTIAITNTGGNNSYTITPNPAHDYINIKATGMAEKVDVKIFDAAGKLVRKAMDQSLATDKNIKIPVSDLTAGNYFIEIRSAINGRQIRQVVIIK